MRILCVCRSGNVRSVATKQCLNKRGYLDAIAIGCSTVSKETFDMLCYWADMILLAKPTHGENIVSGYKFKVNDKFTIGDDVWGTPTDSKLKMLVKKQLDLIGL